MPNTWEIQLDYFLFHQSICLTFAMRDKKYECILNAPACGNKYDFAKHEPSVEFLLVAARWCGICQFSLAAANWLIVIHTYCRKQMCHIRRYNYAKSFRGMQMCLTTYSFQHSSSDKSIIHKINKTRIYLYYGRNGRNQQKKR